MNMPLTFLIYVTCVTHVLSGGDRVGGKSQKFGYENFNVSFANNSADEDTVKILKGFQIEHI